MGIMDKNQIMRPLLWRGVLLFAGVALLLMADFALAAGMTGTVVWAILSVADVAAFAALLLADFRARRDERVLASLTMLLALAFVLGEYGCSTDSSLSFLVSIWKVLAVLLFLAVLAMDARAGFAGARRLAASKKSLCVIGLMAVMAVAMVLQMAFSSALSSKGIVRSLTFYGGVALVVYAAVSLLSSRCRIDVFRAVLRAALACSLVFAFVEMFTDFHLPTCWLYSDDPNVVAQLQEVERSYENWRWVTATGIFFNPNNFCLFLAALAVFSLPARYESPAMRRFSLSLACIALLVCSMLGATIVSTALLVGLALWLAFSPGKWRGRLLVGLVAVLCYFLLPDLCMRTIMAIVGCDTGAVTSVANDFAVQAEGFEQESGSMFSRVVIYRDMVQLVVSHPLGIGPAGIHAYFLSNPSVSYLVDPHSWPLEFAACYGWVPFVLYASLCVWFAASAFRARKADDTGLSPMVFSGFVVCCLGSFAPSSSDFNALLWLPVLLCAALSANRELLDAPACEVGEGGMLSDAPHGARQDGSGSEGRDAK